MDEPTPICSQSHTDVQTCHSDTVSAFICIMQTITSDFLTAQTLYLFHTTLTKEEESVSVLTDEQQTTNTSTTMTVSS